MGTIYTLVAGWVQSRFYSLVLLLGFKIYTTVSKVGLTAHSTGFTCTFFYKGADQFKQSFVDFMSLHPKCGFFLQEGIHYCRLH